MYVASPYGEYFTCITSHHCLTYDYGPFYRWGNRRRAVCPQVTWGGSTLIWTLVWLTPCHPMLSSTLLCAVVFSLSWSPCVPRMSTLSSWPVSKCFALSSDVGVGGLSHLPWPCTLQPVQVSSPLHSWWLVQMTGCPGCLVEYLAGLTSGIQLLL